MLGLFTKRITVDWEKSMMGMFAQLEQKFPQRHFVLEKQDNGEWRLYSDSFHGTKIGLPLLSNVTARDVVMFIAGVIMKPLNE